MKAQKKLSLYQAANKAHSRSCKCRTCQFSHHYTDIVCGIGGACHKSFIEGFMKGVRYQKQLNKQNQIEQ